MLGKAIALAASAFENKVDKGGQPYILHCLRVMNAVDGDEEVKCAAVLHDILEDTDLTVRDLYELGFSATTVGLVWTLTHKKEHSYDQYIEGVSLLESAVLIKQADLRDNSDITRLKGITKKDLDRMAKYHRAWLYLSKCR